MKKTPKAKIGNTTVKQPVPAKGMSFVPIFTAPKTKRRFTETGAVVKLLENASRFLLTQFNSFGKSEWFQVTAYIPLDPTAKENYFLDFVEEAERDGRLHKTNGVSEIWEVC